MTTTELIDLLKKHEFGGATGKPREISFDFRGIFIPTPSIVVDSTGDGLVTEICLGLDTEKLKTNDVAPVVPGKWINGRCSVCGEFIPTDNARDCITEDEVRYCLSCGAKMDGDGE
ncbi:MAG: hypothetical protein IKD01_00495 [Oscillospiraceae bacterium]|nr:hypothetical protein [Oscillospiraceae bacterium]